MTPKCCLVVLLAALASTSSVFCDDHYKYDLAKFARDASSRIGLIRELDQLTSPAMDSLTRALDSLSGRNLVPMLADALRRNESSQCPKDLIYTFKNLMPIGGWGSKMIDAFGKPERGIFQGNLRWLGEFNECVKVYAPRTTPSTTNVTVGGFYGQYCTLTTNAHIGNLTLPLSIGVCLPDSCRPSDILPSTINFPAVGFPSIFTDTKLTCQPKFDKLTTAAKGVIFLLSVFIVLALAGSAITVYEHFARIETSRHFISTHGFENKKSVPVNGTEIDRQSLHDDDDVPILGYARKAKTLPPWLEMVKPFFNCFCVLTNGAKLLDTSSSEGQLPCLHGIRFFSLAWVILGHTYAFVIAYIRNLNEVIPTVDHWPFQIVMNGFFSVDSFFLLSGFLLAYLFFEVASKNNGKVPWVYFYVHRYVRLTPVYLIMLGFNTTLYPYMSSGPTWTTSVIEPNCAKYWWRNVLYINNFFDSTEMCVGWSWYLANDMQFFVISPLFLVALWRWPAIGVAILALFMNATTFANFVISYQNELVAGMGNILVTDQPQAFMVGKWMDFFNMIYLKPYTRIGPYIVGVALAYYLYRRKQSNSGKNSLITLSSGWLVTGSITAACIFGLYHRHMSNLEIAVYAAFNRTCFAIGLAWVIYVCLTGQGGFVNKILSYKLFIPLSRLTYCAYLVHPIIMYLFYSSLKTAIDFNHFTLVLLFLGFIVLSYGTALITSLLFESPIIRLDKFVRNALSSK